MALLFFTEKLIIYEDEKLDSTFYEEGWTQRGNRDSDLS